MTLAIIIYVLLIIVFLALSSLVFRHNIKFGYLCPSFKITTLIFALISIIVISFSIYLLFQINNSSTYDPYDSYTNPSENNNSSSNLNF